MDSFDQLIELANNARDKLEEFYKSNQDVTLEQASINYDKSKEICEGIQKKLDTIEMKEPESGAGYDYDKCVYYLAKDVLNMYEYSASPSIPQS